MAAEARYRAAIANGADVRDTAREINGLIAWHERERALHDNAIATLRKALAHTAAAADAVDAEARDAAKALAAGVPT